MREAVETVITALAAAIQEAIRQDHPEKAANYAGALRDACAGYEYLSEAESE